MYVPNDQRRIKFQNDGASADVVLLAVASQTASSTIWVNIVVYFNL